MLARVPVVKPVGIMDKTYTNEGSDDEQHREKSADNKDQKHDADGPLSPKVNYVKADNSDKEYLYSESPVKKPPSTLEREVPSREQQLAIKTLST